MRKNRIKSDKEVQPVRYFMNGTSYNKSSCVFAVRLRNIGNCQLENFKLYLTFNDDCFTSERVWKLNGFLDTFKYEYNIKWIKGTNNLEFKTANENLVPNDEILSDKICLRPEIEFPFCTIIPWKLVSKDFTEYGVLCIEIEPKVKEKNSIETYSAHFADETLLQNYTGKDED